MLSHNGLDAEMAERIQQLSDGEVGQLLVSSAKQLRTGDNLRREVHRRMVQHCLDLLAERGRAER